MDDAAQNNQIPNNAQQAIDSSQTGDQPSQSSLPAAQAMPVPVSVPVHKEQEPVLVSGAPLKEFIEASQKLPELSKEVSEIGVETKSEVPDLSLDPSHAGLVVHAKESTPAVTDPAGMVKLPMTQQQVFQVKKTSKPSSSILWLANLVLLHLKRLQQKLAQ